MGADAVLVITFFSQNAEVLWVRGFCPFQWNLVIRRQERATVDLGTKRTVVND